jgi:ABC-2 type transport system ATP-binding protein
MIEVHNLSKHYGSIVAVDGLDFQVRPGIVTGFLGPNGSGKSTTMRCIMGLDIPSKGGATINGQRYHGLTWPLREVGALLEARAVHPGRSAYNHLLAMAATNGIGKRRVTEVLELVGLEQVARRRVGKFSLGMGQRLGMAVALLGDPPVLLFDEPVNGLDPEGIRWVRDLLKGLAAGGRTVFVSSHLMSEMAQTADQVVVIGRGRLIANLPMAQFIDQNSRQSVRVRSPEIGRFGELLQAQGLSVAPSDGGAVVSGAPIERVGELAAANAVTLYELSALRASLEDVFMELTADAVEYRPHGEDGGYPTPAPATSSAPAPSEAYPR